MERMEMAGVGRKAKEVREILARGEMIALTRYGKTIAYLVGPGHLPFREGDGPEKGTQVPVAQMKGVVTEEHMEGNTRVIDGFKAEAVALEGSDLAKAKQAARDALLRGFGKR